MTQEVTHKTDDQLLHEAWEIQQRFDQLDRELIEAIQACRDRKISWAAIGKKFGVSRQAAWERFSKRVLPSG